MAEDTPARIPAPPTPIVGRAVERTDSEGNLLGIGPPIRGARDRRRTFAAVDPCLTA